MKGNDSEVVRLAGDWEGEYRGIDSGRTGEIRFALELGRHTADGHVIMGQTGRPLKIRFVEVDDGEVTGRIDAYTDPQCGCQVETEFLGFMAGDRIAGTFVTRIVGTERTQKGEWKVIRRRT